MSQYTCVRGAWRVKVSCSRLCFVSPVLTYEPGHTMTMFVGRWQSLMYEPGHTVTMFVGSWQSPSL